VLGGFFQSQSRYEREAKQLETVGHAEHHAGFAAERLMGLERGFMLQDILSSEPAVVMFEEKVPKSAGVVNTRLLRGGNPAIVPFCCIKTK
jgi:hypothetical protein